MADIILSDANWDVCNALFQAFCECLEECMHPVGYHVIVDFANDDRNPDDPENTYYLHIYEMGGELMGGPDDGAEVFMGLTLDLGAFVDEFGPPTNCGVKCEAPTLTFSTVVYMPENPAVVIEGTYRKRNFTVYIHSEPPKDEKVAVRIYRDGSFEYVDDAATDGDGHDGDETR